MWDPGAHAHAHESCPTVPRLPVSRLWSARRSLLLKFPSSHWVPELKGYHGCTGLHRVAQGWIVAAHLHGLMQGYVGTESSIHLPCILYCAIEHNCSQQAARAASGIQMADGRWQIVQGDRPRLIRPPSFSHQKRKGIGTGIGTGSHTGCSEPCFFGLRVGTDAVTARQDALRTTHATGDRQPLFLTLFPGASVLQSNMIHDP